jgi:hypothetical protein
VLGIVDVTDIPSPESALDDLFDSSVRPACCGGSRLHLVYALQGYVAT